MKKGKPSIKLKYNKMELAGKIGWEAGGQVTELIAVG